MSSLEKKKERKKKTKKKKKRIHFDEFNNDTREQKIDRRVLRENSFRDEFKYDIDQLEIFKRKMDPL